MENEMKDEIIKQENLLKDAQNNLFQQMHNKEISKEKRKLIRKKLIELNIKLADYVLYLYAKYKLLNRQEKENLKSYAYEGLIYAVDNYDASLGNTFTTYAYPCIEGFIKSGIAKESGIPISIYYRFQVAKKNIENEWREKYEPGNDEMLEEILNIMINTNQINEREKEILIDYEKRNNPYPIEIVQDIITTDSEFDSSVVDEVMKDCFVDSMQDVLKTIPDREEKITKLKYGIGYEREYSRKEIAEELNVTGNVVDYYDGKANSKLRHPSRSRRIKDYSDLDFTTYEKTPFIIKSPRDENGFRTK